MPRPSLLAASLVSLGALVAASCAPPAAIEAPPKPVRRIPLPEAPLPAASSAKVPPSPREPAVGPKGERVEVDRDTLTVSEPNGADRTLFGSDLRPAPGDPGLLAILPTVVMFFDDGTLLVGQGDGSVTAVEVSGRKRFSLGFRGAIAGFAPLADGAFLLSTDYGVVASVTEQGKVRWETQVVVDQLEVPVVGPNGQIFLPGTRGVYTFSPQGSLTAFDTSDKYRCCEDESMSTVQLAQGSVEVGGVRFPLAGPHTPAPVFDPVFPVTFTKVVDGPAFSALLAPSGEVMALQPIRKTRYDLVRIAAGRTTRTAIPMRAGASPLWIDGIALSPSGKPWILARKVSVLREDWDFRQGPDMAEGQIFELTGSTLRERADFTTLFEESPLSTHEPLLAAPAGQGSLFCLINSCALFQGSGFRSTEVDDGVEGVYQVGSETVLLTGRARVLRREGDALVRAEQLEGLWLRYLAGVSDRDMWAVSGKGTFVTHVEDSGRQGYETAGSLREGLYARASDDVWGMDGQMHWDGVRWSPVFGAPEGNSLVARAANDVWIAAASGIYHGSAPGPVPVRLGPVVQAELPAADAAPLPMGEVEGGFTSQRMTFAIAGDRPLTMATQATLTPDGTLWLASSERVVEVSAGGKAKVLHRAAWGMFGAPRWVLPTGQGGGLFVQREELGRANQRDTLMTFDGGVKAAAPMQLNRQDIAALSRNERGAVWVVGANTMTYPHVPGPEELAPHALMRAANDAAFQPVVGLPSAAYSDVAVRADGGAYLVGGLNAGPMGEGILVSVAGPAGAGETRRFRAEASLLAVAAAGDDGAWAVGADGTIVHVQGATATRFKQPGRAWLRSVYVASPDDVWVAGDGGTLLHFDGKVFHPVAQPFGKTATFTALVAFEGAIWAVGPSGILRLTRG